MPLGVSIVKRLKGLRRYAYRFNFKFLNPKKFIHLNTLSVSVQNPIGGEITL